MEKSLGSKNKSMSVGMSMATSLRFAFVAVCALGLAACSSTSNNGKGVSTETTPAGYGASSSVSSAPSQPVEVENVNTPSKTELQNFEKDISRVYFATAKHALSDNTKNTLDLVVAFLEKYPETHIRIEGYADPRGSKPYNLALGGSRAAQVKSYLADAGIDPARLATVSYGELNPACDHATAACYAQDRRTHSIVVTNSTNELHAAAHAAAKSGVMVKKLVTSESAANKTIASSVKKGADVVEGTSSTLPSVSSAAAAASNDNESELSS